MRTRRAALQIVQPLGRDRSTDRRIWAETAQKDRRLGDAASFTVLGHLYTAAKLFYLGPFLEDSQLGVQVYDSSQAGPGGMGSIR